jgi:hypothetical protein
MKNLSTSAQRNSFCKLIAGLTLSIGLFVAGTASAQTSSEQTLSFADHAPLHTQTSDKFKVVVFPVAYSQSMKVVLENPSKDKVSVLIKDSNDKIVYRKMVGTKAVFIGTFDVSNLTDGDYTMVIESDSQSYSNSFSLQLQQERIAKVY